MITNLTAEDAAGILQARIERHGVGDVPADYIPRVLNTAAASLSGEVFSLQARVTVRACADGTFTIRTVSEEV